MLYNFFLSFPVIQVPAPAGGNRHVSVARWVLIVLIDQALDCLGCCLFGTPLVSLGNLVGC